MPEITQWLIDSANSPWLLPVLFLLVVGDAFLVVLPSETVVVALAALAAATGAPSLMLVVPVAAAGAVVGDLLCFLIGRRVGVDRWAWQRRRRVAAAIGRVREAVRGRPAVLIFTARYIPFARIAVNLSAGAAGLPIPQFLPLSAMAGTAWALYNVGIGAAFGSILRDQPVIAIIVSIVVAVGLGLAIDSVARRLAAARSRRRGDDAPTSRRDRAPRSSARALRRIP